MRVETEHAPIEGRTDARGRLRLGSEWADTRVRVAVLADLDAADDEPTLPDIERRLDRIEQLLEDGADR